MGDVEDSLCRGHHYVEVTILWSLWEDNTREKDDKTRIKKGRKTE